MRISHLRYSLVVLLAISISGCYSGGKWSMPNLAFWKSSPFSSSTASAIPPTTTTPTKPSNLTTNISANNSTGMTMAPSYQNPTAKAAAAGAAVTPQYSYTPSSYTPSPAVSPSATPASSYTASTMNAVGSSPYLPPQQGPYGSAGTALKVRAILPAVILPRL